MSPKIPPQILRLILLTCFIVFGYLGARVLLTPSSFGQFGWYRGDALTELSAKQPIFAGQVACEECHSDIVKEVTKYEHKTLGCETCHGVAKPHVDDPEKPTAKISDHFCMRCHDRNPSRPEWFKQIELKKHYTGQSCKECHIPHHPSEVP